MQDVINSSFISDNMHSIGHGNDNNGNNGDHMKSDPVDLEKRVIYLEKDVKLINDNIAILNNKVYNIEVQVGIISGQLIKLDAKIDKLENKFDAKIDKLENKFDDKFDKLENKLENKMDAMNKELKGEMGALKDFVTNKVNEAMDKQYRNQLTFNIGAFIAFIVTLVTLFAGGYYFTDLMVKDKFNSYKQQYELQLKDNEIKVNQTPEFTTDNSQKQNIK